MYDVSGFTEGRNKNLVKESRLIVVILSVDDRNKTGRTYVEH